MGAVSSMQFRKATFWVQIHNVPLLCMTKEIGRFLGQLIGEVVELDVGASGNYLGKYMRVRVVVDLSKPLKRFLKVNKPREEKGMADHEFKYEMWLRASSLGRNFNMRGHKESNTVARRVISRQLWFMTGLGQQREFEKKRLL
ncbi:hypothetical protein ACOSP7_014139 [Xanthoceras sorbifolium]